MKTPPELLELVIARFEGHVVQLRVMRDVIDRAFAHQIHRNRQKLKRLKAQRPKRKRRG